MNRIIILSSLPTKGHPSSHCTKAKKQDDNDKSLSSKASVKKLKKELKSANKKLATVNTHNSLIMQS